MERRKVKVAIRVRDQEGGRLPREWLWAEVVDQSAGIYCLFNTPFFAPFALGDLVETRRRRNGDLVVTKLHRRGGRTAHLVVFPVTVDRAAVQRLADEWAATGTWVEGCGNGTALTVAVERLAGGRPDEAELAALELGGRLEQLMLLADPDEPPDAQAFAYLDSA